MGKSQSAPETKKEKIAQPTGCSRTRRLIVGLVVEDWPKLHYMLRSVSPVDVATICFYYSHCDKMKRYAQENYGEFIPKDPYQIYNIRRNFWLGDKRYDISLNEMYEYKVTGVTFKTAVKDLANAEFETLEDLLEFYTEYE